MPFYSPANGKVEHNLFRTTRNCHGLDITPDAFHPLTATTPGETDSAQDLDGIPYHMLQDDAGMSFELGYCTC